MKHSPAKVMQPSELARLAGISIDTLRYYERNRLLPAAQRSLSGYRFICLSFRVNAARGNQSFPKCVLTLHYGAAFILCPILESLDKEVASTEHGNKGLLALPGVGVSILPKLACPTCWPAYAGLLSSVGLGFLISAEYLLLLTVAFFFHPLGAIRVLATRAKKWRGFLGVQHKQI